MLCLLGHDGDSDHDRVDAYNTSLTRSGAVPCLRKGVFSRSQRGDYALFAGGFRDSNTVDAYDTSLTRSTPTTLSVRREYLAGASVGNYALFAGGEYISKLSTVDAYDTSLTRSTPTALILWKGIV